MSQTFPRPPKTPPLHRLYYYQDQSTTRLLNSHPLEIDRQPKDKNLRWKTSHWSLDTWMSRINWTLTLDAWTLQDAPWDPITGLPTLPATWTTLPFSHGHSPLAFASPYGHLLYFDRARRPHSRSSCRNRHRPRSMKTRPTFSPPH